MAGGRVLPLQCGTLDVLAGILACVAGATASSILGAADVPQAPPAGQTTVPPVTKNGGGGAAKPDPATPNPLGENQAQYRQNLTPAERVVVLQKLQLKMGFGTDAQEEASFWYGLNARKLDDAAWQKVGLDTLQKLAKGGKTVWKSRARNALIDYELSSPEGDLDRLDQYKKDLTNELAKNERDAQAVETAVMLAKIAGRLKDNDLAINAIQQALTIAKYISYSGQFTLDEMKAVLETRKVAARPVADNSAEPKATFEAAEKHRLAGMTKKDSKDPKADPKDSAAAEYQQALDLYAQVIAQYPDHELAQFAAVRTAECEMRTGKLEKAGKRLQAFLQAAPLGPYRGQGHVLWGDLYLEYYFDGHRAEVEYNAVFKPSKYAAALKNLYRVAGRPFFAPDMTGDIALRAWANNGEDPLAAEAKAAADKGVQEDLKKAELPEGVDPTWKDALADAHMRLGILAYMRNDLKGADQHFTMSFRMQPEETYGTGVPTGLILLAEKCRNKEKPVPSYLMRVGGERPRIALFLAGCNLSGGKFEESAALFKRIADGEFADATSDQTAYALRTYGESAWYAGNPKAAWEAWKKFDTAPWSNSAEAPEALLRYGCSRYTVTQNAENLAYLEKVYQQYPSSPAAPLALFQQACVIWRSDPHKASELLTICQRNYPHSVHKDQIPGMLKRFKDHEQELAKTSAAEKERDNVAVAK